MAPTDIPRAESDWQTSARTVHLVRRIPGADLLLSARFLRFLLVGLSGVFVNMGTLWFLTEVGGLYYLASSLVAVELSIVSNFLVNNAWTFKDRSDGIVRLSALARYNLVCAGGIVGSTTILYVLATYAGVYYLVANLVAITATAVWNFVANTRWTWKQNR